MTEYERIEDTSQPSQRVDPAEVAAGLGAEEIRPEAQVDVRPRPKREVAGSNPAGPTTLRAPTYWTVTWLLHRQPTESKYEILQRADRIFAGKCGRYYMGPISRDEVRRLTEKVELRADTRALVDEFVAGMDVVPGC